MSFPDVLGPEDLEPGMYITPRQQHELEGEDDDDDDEWRDHHMPFPGAPPPRPKPKPTDIRGEPFLVVSHEHPFIATMHVPSGTRAVLDYRKFEFIEVGHDYARYLVKEDHYKDQYAQIFDGSEREKPLPEIAAQTHLDPDENTIQVVTEEGFKKREDMEKHVIDIKEAAE